MLPWNLTYRDDSTFLKTEQPTKTTRNHKTQTNCLKLFGISNQHLTMNDDRPKIHRQYSRDFQRSSKEAELFKSGIRKINMSYDQKQERSIPRRYKNDSQMKMDQAGIVSTVQLQLKTGLKKVDMSPAKTDRFTSKKHFQQKKYEPQRQVYIVPQRTNTGENGEVRSAMMFLKLAKNKPSQLTLYKQPESAPLTERRHYNGRQRDNQMMQVLRRDKENQIDNGKKSKLEKNKSDINFHVDFYKKEDRMPECKKTLNTSRQHKQLASTQRLIKRFR